jgi:hypothetical protein
MDLIVEGLKFVGTGALVMGCIAVRLYFLDRG